MNNVTEKQFMCGVDGCNKEFARKFNLVRHILTHSDDFKQIQCPVCEKLFVEKIQLERHYQVHLKQEKKTDFKCLICMKFFNRKADLVRHKKTVHQEKLFQCDQCSQRRFGTKFAVLRHFKIVHLGVKDKRRKPVKKVPLHKILSLSAREEEFLAENVQDDYNEDNAVMVEILDYVETDDAEVIEIETFNTHIFEAETSKIYQPETAKLIPQNIQKIVHWKCQRCNQNFDNVQRLKLHNSRNHNWKCKKCPGGKSHVNFFFRREDFELHWMENHGDEVFPGKLQCLTCFDMFANLSALHNHQKNDHNMSISKAPTIKSLNKL